MQGRGGSVPPSLAYSASPSSMLHVQSIDDAKALARTLCQQHANALQDVASVGDAKVAATKIFADELLRASAQRELRELVVRGHRDRAIEKAKEMHRGDPSGFLATMRCILPELTPSSSPSAGGAVYASPNRNPHHPSIPKRTWTSQLLECPYCDEPSSRYCKESGLQHATGKERALSKWKRVFDHLLMASTQLSRSRVEEPNTCEEEFEVVIGCEEFGDDSM